MGRLSFIAGADGRAGRSRRAAWPSERLAGRLLGDMDGSLYERAWDGGRVAGAARRLALVGGGRRCPRRARSRSRPTCRSIGCAVAALDVTAAPGALARAHPLRRRSRSGIATRVTCTPDPTTATLPATAADVSIGTVGVSATGVYPAGGGAWELTASAAGQFGDWYGQPHRAVSALVEGGLPLARGAGAAAGAGGRDLRLGRRRWRRRSPRHVLHDAALGRSLRAVEHLRADERGRRRGARRDSSRIATCTCRRPCTTWRWRRAPTAGIRAAAPPSGAATTSATWGATRAARARSAGSSRARWCGSRSAGGPLQCLRGPHRRRRRRGGAVRRPAPVHRDAGVALQLLSAIAVRRTARRRPRSPASTAVTSAAISM